MKKIWTFAIGIWLVLLAQNVSAVRVNALYRGEIPTTSQSASERSQVASQALEQVFIKVSGNNQIISNPAIKSHLSAANSMIQQYAYGTLSVPSPGKNYLLQIDFDPEAINQILRNASVPIWGQSRPLLMVWLVYDLQGKTPVIVSADAANSIAHQLKQNADQRGVPVIFPMMDVTDLNQVTAKDVSAMTLPVLTQASKRYASDGMLIGYIHVDNKGYNTQWKLILGNDQSSLSSAGKGLPEILKVIINNVADNLASHYAVVMSNSAQVKITLKVVGITQADDFTQMMNYLQHLTQVTDVQLLQVLGSDVELSVSLRGTQESFTQAVALGQKMTPAQPQEGMLVYQWNH